MVSIDISSLFGIETAQWWNLIFSIAETEICLILLRVLCLQIKFNIRHEYPFANY